MNPHLARYVKVRFKRNSRFERCAIVLDEVVIDGCMTSGAVVVFYERLSSKEGVVSCILYLERGIDWEEEAS